jgi:hypothetical protein
MDRIRYYAYYSVLRGCGYYLLFSLPVLIGLLKYPLIDLRSAAQMLTLLWAWLAWRAWRVPHTDYHRSALWELLDRWHGLPEAKAHRAISGVLRQAYLLHADLSALTAAGLWLIYFAAAQWA